MERDPAVYIMASGFHGTIYTGVTSNLIRRVAQHREGVIEGFTADYAVKRLVWFEVHGTIPCDPARKTTQELAASLEDGAGRGGKPALARLGGGFRIRGAGKGRWTPDQVQGDEGV